MKRIRTLTALLLAVVLLAGTVPARALEPSETPEDVLAETLPEDSTEETEEETAETLPEDPAEEPAEAPSEDSVETPEEEPDESLTETPPEGPDGAPVEEGSSETGEPVGGGDVSGGDGGGLVAEVSTSDQFRDALKDPAVKDIYFIGHIIVAASDGENNLEALDKKILPYEGDYQNNSLSFAPGVTLLQISPHEGNQAQAVEDQSISQIYGTQKDSPDIFHLTELVPGTVGWYEYHDPDDKADEYAGKRVCYTMYFGTAADAIVKAADLTAGHWRHKATGTGDDNRLVFTAFGEPVTLTAGHVIETDMMYIIPSSDAGNNDGLTIQDGGSLRVNRHLEVWGDVAVGTNGSLDMSYKEITQTGPDTPDGNVSFFIDRDLVVEPVGDIAFGTLDSWVNGDVILGKWIPKPEKLGCGGMYIPCLAAKWGEGSYDFHGIGMTPRDEYEVTFALCEYAGKDADPQIVYTDLTEEELAALAIRRVQSEPDGSETCALKYGHPDGDPTRWVLTAWDTSLGETYEITYTKDSEAFTLPASIRMPELGCYDAPEANLETYVTGWPFNPLGANEFYVCVDSGAWFLNDPNWRLPKDLSTTAWREGDSERKEVPGAVETRLLDGNRGIWKVTVNEFNLHVEFSITLEWVGPADGAPGPDETPAPGTGVWIEPAERLVFSEAPLTGNPPVGVSESSDQLLTEENRQLLSDTLTLHPGESKDVALYLLRYEASDQFSGWICEYTSPEWADVQNGEGMGEAVSLAAVEGTLLTSVLCVEGSNTGRAWIRRMSGEDTPDPNSPRGIALRVSVEDGGTVVDPGDPGAPRLMVKLLNERYGEGLWMTPWDEYEVSFALRTSTAGESGEPVYSYEDIAPDDPNLQILEPLAYVNRPEEVEGSQPKDHWVLTAQNAYLDQTYEITYTRATESGETKTYTLPVRVELPQLGIYEQPNANGGYLQKYSFNPLMEANEFYICVKDLVSLREDGWEIADTLKVYCNDAPLDVSAVSSPVRCEPHGDGIWKVTVTAPDLNLGFELTVTRKDETDTFGTGIWIEPAERLVFSGEPLKGSSPYPDDPDSPDRLLDSVDKTQLQEFLSLRPGETVDVVLYLLVYHDGSGDDPIKEPGWVCECTSRKWAEGREGVLLTDGPDRSTRVTLEPDYSYSTPHIARLDGQWVPNESEPGGGHHEPDRGTTRGIPLSVYPIYSDRLLMADWGGGNFGSTIEMTPYDEPELSFALCRYDYTQNKYVLDVAISPEEISIHGPLDYRQLEDHGNKWCLTARDMRPEDRDTLWGQIYEISCSRDGQTYSMPLLINLPEVGFYRWPQADQGSYLANWDFDPTLEVNEFYICVDPNARFMHDGNWSLPADIEVKGVRYQENGTSQEVPGSVTCEAVSDMAGVWKVTVTKPDLNVEFSMTLDWQGVGEAPLPENTPVIRTNLWVEAAQRLLFSDALLDGNSPYPDDPDSRDRLLSDIDKSQLQSELTMNAGSSRDIVLYLLVYDGKTGQWVCEHTHRDWAEGRDGVILMEVPEEGKDAFTRVILRADCGMAHIARLHGQELSGDNYEPIPGSTRGIPLSVYPDNVDGLVLMADWGGGNYGDIIEMTPYDEPDVSFALCQYNKDEGRYEQVKEIDPAAVQVPGPLKYEKLESRGGKWVLRIDENEDRNSLWGQVFQITYAEDPSGTKAYSLPVLMNLPEAGFYWGPNVTPEDYLPNWQYDPLLNGPNEVYFCLNPDAWFMNNEDWGLPADIEVKGMRYQDNGASQEVSGSVSYEMAGNGVWKILVTKPDIRVEVELTLVGQSGDTKDPAPVIGGSLWVEAGQWLVCSDRVLTDGDPLDPNDSNDPSRTLTDANRELLKGKLEVPANTVADVVLYLLVYDGARDVWTCEYTSPEWAEGRDGVMLMEAEREFFSRVTASWGNFPHIARLEGKETSPGRYDPISGSTRGNPLPVVVSGDPDAPRLMVQWPGGDYGDSIVMTPFDEHEVTFVLHSDTASTDTPLSAGDLRFSGPLKYVERTETDGENTKSWWVLTAEGAEWNKTYFVTYTPEGGGTYTLPVYIRLPDLGCYSEPRISTETYLRNWQFNPLADANEFYICVNPDAWFNNEDEKWDIGALIVKAWRDGDSTDTDPSGYISGPEKVDGEIIAWKITANEAALHVNFEIPLTLPGPDGNAMKEASCSGSIWVEPVDRLVFSDAILKGAPLGSSKEDLNQLLTKDNRGLLRQTVTLNAGASRDLALYLLVYDYNRNLWTCKYADSSWYRTEGGAIQLTQLKDSPLFHVKALSQGTAKIVHLKGDQSTGDYAPVDGSTRGVPLNVTVSRGSSDQMTVTDSFGNEEKVEAKRVDRKVTVSSSTNSLSDKAPLFAAGYSQDGRLISVTALTGTGTVSFSRDVAYYQLIWTDGTRSPRCQSVLEYLGVN